MDRSTFYYGEIVRNFDLLSIGQLAMVGLAELTQATLGTNVALLGLAVTPGTGLAVSMAAGSIYQQAELEATALGGGASGGLPQNTTLIQKQGISLSAQTLSPFPAPFVAGQSINYLIEVQYQDNDYGAVVLPYFNAADPEAQWSGPANSGATQSYVRQGIVAWKIKAGTAAATNSQMTPSVDSGWTALAVVTVAYGQTSISSGNISAPAGNTPFIPTTLPQIPSAIQGGQWVAYPDTGSANTYVITPASPAIVGTLTAGMQFRVLIANANTGASTLNVNGLGAIAIRRSDQSVLQANDLVANMEAILTYDGTYFQLAVPSPYAWARDDYAVDTGSANAYVVALPYALSAYADGVPVAFKAANASTGASTLNVNSLGVVPLVRIDGTALQRDDIKAGDDCFTRYNSTSSSFELIDLAPNAAQYQTGNSGTAGGTANALTVTLSPAPTSQAIMLGMPIRLKIATSNTGAATLNVNGFGAQPIVTANGFSLAPNALTAGLYTEVIWNGTSYQIASAAALGLEWTYIAASAALGPGFYTVDTTAGPVTITMEATPALGDNYSFMDFADNFATNNLILNPNGGGTILGVVGNLNCDVDSAEFTIAFKSGNWNLQ